MPNFTPSTSMNAAKKQSMEIAATYFETLEDVLQAANPDPRLAAVARTQLEIAAAMYNKAIAFGPNSDGT